MAELTKYETVHSPEDMAEIQAAASDGLHALEELTADVTTTAVGYHSIGECFVRILKVLGAADTGLLREYHLSDETICAVCGTRWAMADSDHCWGCDR